MSAPLLILGARAVRNMALARRAGRSLEEPEKEEQQRMPWTPAWDSQSDPTSNKLKELKAEMPKPPLCCLGALQVHALDTNLGQPV
jgi:hypothetical protein